MTVAVDWGLPPERAVAFFAAKGLAPTFAWPDMLHAEHDAAFTVAKMMDLDLLSEVREEVGRAIADGVDFRTWRAELEPLLVERGWWGRATLPDPQTGELVDVQLGSVRRLRTIYETNLRTAYAAGHWSGIEAEAERAPYLLYDAILDAATRDDHRQWDGLVLRWDDPWWATHYPPNGWGCRCGVIQLTHEQLREMGRSGPDRAPSTPTREWVNPRTGEVQRVPFGIDPGWDYHVGSTRTAELRDQLQDKARGAAPTIAQPVVDVVERAAPPTLASAQTTGSQVVAELLAAAPAPEQFRRRLAERLEREVGAGTRSIATAGQPTPSRRAVARASRAFPASWIAAADRAGPLHVRSAGSGRGWAWTAPDTDVGRRIKLRGFGIVTIRAPHEGFIATHPRRPSTSTHELGHRLQQTMPGLDDYFQQLHERRTAGAELVPLSTLDPSRRWRPNEVARAGNAYIHPYWGKEYTARATGMPVGRAGALEVMPMTFEHLFGTIEQLAELLRDDRELAELAVGLLLRYRE